MKFQDLEQLGQPDGISILATKRALEQAGGHPSIDYGNLGELMEEDLHLADYRIKFYDGTQLGAAPGPFAIWRSGYPTLWNKTLHVPVTNMSGANPMTRLIAAGLSARAKRERRFPVRYWKAEVAAASLGSLIAGEVAGIDAVSTVGVFGLLAIAAIKTDSDKIPLKQSRQETLQLRYDHEQDIVFPKQRDALYL